MHHEQPFLLALDYLGTFAFALSGALKAARKRMDLFGLIVLAAITAVGGGTVRDLLLGDRRPFWLSDDTYILLCLVAAAAVFLLFRLVARAEALLLVFDAIGLGVFTVIGTSLAMDAGLGAIDAVALGCLTGVGGGILRDVLAGDIPLILQHEVYASASILGAAALWGLRSVGAPASVAVGVCGVSVVVVRLVSVHYGFGLPQAVGLHAQDLPEPPQDR